MPLPQGLFPRIGTPFSLNGDTSPPSARPPGPGGPPPPFPGFVHPFSQAFPGRPFPFPGGLPPHHFLPNFKHERDIDAGKVISFFV